MSKKLPDIIALAKSNKPLPIMDLIRDKPEISAIISKLVNSTTSTAEYDKDGNRTIGQGISQKFNNVSEAIARKNDDAQSVMELFPELELSAQILISSIISPKDMSSTDINYSVPPGLKSTDITASLITEVKNYLSKDYKIENILPIILRKILFETGSYPVAVIPESSIDLLINGTGTESISEISDKDKRTLRAIGILGNPDSDSSNKSSKPTLNLSTSLESINSNGLNSINNYKYTIEHLNETVLVTDNFSLLKLPRLYESKRKKVLSSIIYKNSQGLAAEALQKFNDRNLSSLLFRSPNTNSKNIIKIKTQDEVNRKTVGEPLVLVLPPESVIPITVPGNREEHIGYFVVVDNEGNPLNLSENGSDFDDLQSRLNKATTNNMSSFLLGKAKTVYGDNCSELTVQQATQIYADIVEADLLSRLKNGILGKDLSISKNKEVYRLMLARSLKAQFTQMLFIPVELMTYFAYKYDKNGIGKSLLDDMRILNSLRAMVMFSKVMAELKNSIGRTNVNVDLDENDPNPQKTIQTLIHEIGKTRRTAFPLGLNSPADLADWIQTSGIQFQFNNHPGLPNVKLAFTEESSNYTKPDSDLEDDLRKRAIMGIGLSPETVDNGYAGEFATTVVANNLLLAKRVLQIQQKILPLLSSHVRKLLINNGNIIEKLTDIVKTNINKVATHLEGIKLDETNTDYAINLIVQEFISNLEVTLPQPNNITLENQMAAFDSYVEALDKALPHLVSDQTMPSSLVGEELKEKIEEISNVIKSYYCRRWLSENGVMPELFELTSLDDDGNPLVQLKDIQTNHNSSLAKSIIGLFEVSQPVVQATKKDLEKLGVSEIKATDADTGDNSSDSSSSSGDDFDFGSDMDLGDDTATSDENTDQTSEEDKNKEDNAEDKDQGSTSGLPDLD